MPLQQCKAVRSAHCPHRGDFSVRTFLSCCRQIILTLHQISVLVAVHQIIVIVHQLVIAVVVFIRSLSLFMSLSLSDAAHRIIIITGHQFFIVTDHRIIIVPVRQVIVMAVLCVLCRSININKTDACCCQFQWIIAMGTTALY